MCGCLGFGDNKVNICSCVYFIEGGEIIVQLALVAILPTNRNLQAFSSCITLIYRINIDLINGSIYRINIDLINGSRYSMHKNTELVAIFIPIESK